AGPQRHPTRNKREEASATTIIPSPMGRQLRALRGATTLDADTREQVMERTASLIRTILERNGIGHEDLVSLIFTATDDVRSEFPAAAARGIGISDVPLLCARELDV